MKKEERELLEAMNTYQLAQELNLAKEALSLRQMEEFLELTRKVEENERRRMAKQEQEEKTT